MAKDFRLLGLDEPSQLAGEDPYALYDELCKITGTRHDPCVIDTFISAVRFMDGAPPTAVVALHGRTQSKTGAQVTQRP